MPQSPNTRYGLNLNLGLYFEGTLDLTNAKRLGAYVLGVVGGYEHDSATLTDLTGDIFGRPASEYWAPGRKLNEQPIIGHYRPTALDVLRADISRRYEFDRSDDDLVPESNIPRLLVEGSGILHIPRITLYKKYSRLLSGEYLTDALDRVKDPIEVTIDSENQLHFSIQVGDEYIRAE